MKFQNCILINFERTHGQGESRALETLSESKPSVSAA